jgi:hypothetical protein
MRSLVFSAMHAVAHGSCPSVEQHPDNVPEELIAHVRPDLHHGHRVSTFGGDREGAGRDAAGGRDDDEDAAERGALPLAVEHPGVGIDARLDRLARRALGGELLDLAEAGYAAGGHALEEDLVGAAGEGNLELCGGEAEPEPGREDDQGDAADLVVGVLGF